jgi:erythromycin esterase
VSHSRFAFTALVALVLTGAGCRRSAPVQVAAPVALEPAGAVALTWIDQHASPITISDSGRATIDPAALHAFVANARIVGISELTEGTREFPALIRALIWGLAERDTLRALAIQAPAAEAMELDRYVRGGSGTARATLRLLGSTHWETREMIELVDWLRAFNRTRPVPAQVGFYGFEIPNIAHAARVVTSLSDTSVSPSLKQWLTQQYGCVVEGERANWGREGYAADSTYWRRCAAVAFAAADSLGALRQRVAATRPGSDIAFAEQMARLVAHSADVGLRRLPRHEAVAEHVLWIANTFATNGTLLVWGRDVEAGRLTLPNGGPTQMAVALTQKVSGRYRALAFAVGQGTIRAQRLAMGREPGGETALPVGLPLADSYENVLNRSRHDAFLLDLRQPPSGEAGTWLTGPHSIRLISGQYAPEVQESFVTAVKFPEYYDGILFVKRAVAASKP